MDKLFNEFKEKLAELAHLNSAFAVLYWDSEVYMPEGGSKTRAQTVSQLAGLIHEKFLAPEFKKILAQLKSQLDENKLEPSEAAIVREVWREFKMEEKLPLEFVKELARITSEAHHIWAEARKKSDFKKFEPQLAKIVELKRKQANFLGFKNSPYDALLDIFEPYSDVEEISLVLNDLKKFSVPFVEKIKKSKIKPEPDILKGDFELKKQGEFNKKVAGLIGFDFKAGRIDPSTHPFTINFHPKDVRFTTRYKKDDLFYSLFSTIHETGHALYEQGILAENFGTPLAESVSLGIHESQSRVWENIVCRGRHFWKYFYPVLKKEFPEPFSKINAEEFYKAINVIRPSLIRTEADEVTYNLHIILRFEIEKELIEGSIEVADLPKIWNAKIKEYFGIDVPDDTQGVLQDVHWSSGLFGYFPTYTLGNLYSAQFYNAAKRDIANLEEQISSGKFGIFKEWLRKNIHIHGKLYKAPDLARNITGEELNSKHFIDYINRKYSEIYQL
jgi:carboxypeptidase Taq